MFGDKLLVYLRKLGSDDAEQSAVDRFLLDPFEFGFEDTQKQLQDILEHEGISLRVVVFEKLEQRKKIVNSAKIIDVFKGEIVFEDSGIL